VITFENVSKVYDGEHLAVDELSFKADEGELIVLIGPSGCGKTTTLQMINRLVEPTSGKIMVNGQDHSSFDPVELRRTMGYVIQEIGLFPHMTVGGNITVVPDLEGWSSDEKKQRARELLDLVGMDPDTYHDRFPAELSGGQQQRIGVLRALAVDPDILLMDEPFGALDPLTRSQLQDELTSLQERVKKTIIFVTHDMDEALKIADRIVLMKEGERVQFASPDEMLKNPANDFVAEFVGTERLIKSPMEVSLNNVMLSALPQVERGNTLKECLEIMKDKNTDYVSVVDDDDKFVGIGSADKIRRMMDDEGEDVSIGDSSLKRASIPQEANILEAVHLLAESEDEVLTVLDSENQPVGTFARGSLPRILVDELWPLDAMMSRESEVEELQ